MSEEKKRYSFDKPHEFEYEITHADGEVEVIQYRLVTMSGANRDQYIKAVKKNLIKGVDGKADMKDPEGVTALVLTFCCERNYADENSHADWRAVKMPEIQAWPGPMQEELNDIASKMGGLNKTAKEDAKNE